MKKYYLNLILGIGLGFGISTNLLADEKVVQKQNAKSVKKVESKSFEQKLKQMKKAKTDPTVVLKFLRDEAAKNNTKAMIELGKLANTIDIFHAYSWFKKAEDLKDFDGSIEIAKLYNEMRHMCLRDNKKNSYEELLMIKLKPLVVDKGCAKAMVALADISEDILNDFKFTYSSREHGLPLSTKEYYKKARLQWLQHAVDQDNTIAMRKLAKIYEYSDKITAFDLLNRAVKLNDSEAMVELAELYGNKPIHAKKVTNLYEKAAQLDNFEAIKYLAQKAYEAKNYDKSLKLAMSISNTTDGKVLVLLGNLFYAKDDKKNALIWYKKAEKSENQFVQHEARKKIAELNPPKKMMRKERQQYNRNFSRNYRR